MWLYTLAEFSCIRNAYLKAEMEHVKERMIARFYRGSANDGLALLREYTDRFNARPVTGPKRFVVEYRLIGINELPDDTDGALLGALLADEISRDSIERDLKD